MIGGALYATVNVAIALAEGFAFQKYNVEGHLEKCICCPQLKDPSVQLGIIVMASFFLNNFLGGLTVAGRRRYGVKHPIVYPNVADVKSKTEADRLSFIRIVRGHENYLEYAFQFLFVALFSWIAFGNHSTVFVLTLAFLGFRVIYAFGYSIHDKLRGPGYLLSHLAFLALHGIIIFKVFITLFPQFEVYL